MRIILGAAATLVTLVIGCSGPPGDTPGASSASDPELAALVDPVVSDAAARLAVDPAAIRVVAVQAVTWSDGSLGCPRPGELYTQALVDGHQVIVEAGGVTLDYRVTGPGAFRVCESPGSPAP